MTHDLTPDRARQTVELGLAAHRASLLWLAVASLLVGMVMIVTGAPAFLEDWFSPWSRVVLGLAAFLPALCTVIGMVIGPARRCGWTLQVIGLSGQALWYALMMATYSALLIKEGPQFVGLGEPLSSTVSGRAYVPLIYVGLLGQALVPLWTVVRLGPPR